MTFRVSSGAPLEASPGASVLAPPFRLVLLDQIDSTNDEAKRLARQGAGHGTVIRAREQTAGRGRRGRSWLSPPGNLHISLLLDPGVPLSQAAQLGFVASAALAEAVARLVPDALVQSKWPNDVWCQNRKIAGMLLEPAEVDRLVVLGIGVNVAHAPTGSPPLYDSTCLKDLGCEADASLVLVAFLEAFAPLFTLWQAEGFAPIRSAWGARARGLGGPITVRLERETLVGNFGGLDDDGALMLELGLGQRRRIVAGDVFFPQP